MNTVPRPVLDAITVVPLADVDTKLLLDFADRLAVEPRYFGTGAVPRPSNRWRARLCHPAKVRGVAALVDDELVGVARLWSGPTGRVDMYLAVDAPWRQLGIGSRLAAVALTIAEGEGELSVVAIAEHRRAPVRALARRFSMETTIDGPGGLEFHRRLAS